MDITQMLHELRQDRERLDYLINAAENYARAGSKRRGRPPKWMTAPRNLRAEAKRRGRPAVQRTSQAVA